MIYDYVPLSYHPLGNMFPCDVLILAAEVEEVLYLDGSKNCWLRGTYFILYLTNENGPVYQQVLNMP